MKIAICKRDNSFSEKWIQYCQTNGLEYKIVNPYRNDIVAAVSDCDAFMWHFHQADYRDMLFAKSLILSLEARGIRCFPNGATCWHFDDKVAEKYLLESVGAPAIPSYVFYTKKEALDWIAQTDFPKVFKLKGGAGAVNVKLIHSSAEAIRYVEQCFGKGYRQYRWREHYQEQKRKYKQGKVGVRDVLRPISYALKRYPTEFDHYRGVEIGYAYFQDFIANNDHDTRVVVIGGSRAMAEVRYCRKNDFRASGSGIFEYGNIDKQIIKIAFETAQKLKMQSVAFDFVIDNGMPLIVEISYGFGTHGISHSGGYWTQDLEWHQSTELDFCGWMVENLIK